MADEAPEHVWYRGREVSPGVVGLLCVTGGYHWGGVSASAAEPFPEWTEELYLESLGVIDPDRADEIRAADEEGEEISWQLP